MENKQRTEGDRFEFGAIALANLLPIVGYFVLDWEYTAVFMLYWVDIVALWLVYCGCALFAQRRSYYEEREQPILVQPLRDRFWSDTPRKIGSLPPIYPRNLRVIIPTSVLIMFTSFVGGAAMLERNPDGGMPGTTQGDPVAFLADFSVFTSPPIFGTALLFLPYISLPHIESTFARANTRRRQRTAYSSYPPVLFLSISVDSWCMFLPSSSDC